jgi:hypothetical protein
MRSLLQIFIFTCNVLFLLINGMKGVLSHNPSGLTYFGLLLAAVTTLYFLPAIAKIAWVFMTHKAAADQHEHVTEAHL